MLAVLSERLDCGLEVVVTEMPHLHYADVGAYLRCGSRFESQALNGVSHFVEHMVFRGTRRWPDIVALNRAFEDLGCELDADTGVESGRYRMAAHPSRIDAALELMCDVLFAPSFPQDAIEAERRVLTEEALGYVNELGNTIDTYELSCEQMYPKSGIALSTGGTETSLRGIRREHLLAHHARFYDPRNVVLAVSGGVDGEAVLEAARQIFDGVKQTGVAVGDELSLEPVDETQAAPRVRVVQDPDNQAQIQLSFRAMGYTVMPESLEAVVLGQVLGGSYTSRICYEIREKTGLAYDIGASTSSTHDIGALDVNITTRAEQVGKVVSQVVDELLRLRDGDSAPDAVGEDEVERVRRRWLFDLDAALDNPASQSERYGWGRLYGVAESDKVEKHRLAAIDAGKIQALARRLLVPERANLVVVGPAEVPRPEALRRELLRLA